MAAVVFWKCKALRTTSTDMNSTKIAAWEERIAELDALISPLEDEKSKIEHRILGDKSPFVVGDIIVEWNGGKGRVVEIVEWVCGDPQWKVVNIRKDGSEGSTRLVRNYDKPRLFKAKEGV
jgi:hypothetical protein